MPHILLIILLYANSIFAQSLLPQSTNTQDQPITNQQINYTVNLSNIQIGKSFGISYSIPSNLQIISIDSNINALGDTDIQITNVTPQTIDAEVTSYAITSYPMPSLLITALDTNNTTNVFFTPSFTIPISNDIISNTNLSLADIEPIYFVWNHLWTIAIIVAILLILGIFLIPTLLRPREQKEIKIQIDPFDLVNRKLNQLKVQSFELTEESYKEFFVELSECIREFLSNTIIPLALEMPTRDILAIMKQLQLNSELQEIITSILRNTDRAKYAKQIFAQERIQEVVSDSFKLVSFVKRKQDMEKADELRKS